MPRVARVVAWFFVSSLATVAFAWWWSAPSKPDPFYTASSSVPGTPGSLLRQEPFERRVPAGARAWRILFTTTDAHGAPTLSSAIVMVSATAPEGPRPVVAWTHGTIGVARGCAPSLLDDPFANVPGLPQMLERGWLYVAADYAGESTPGPAPYLIGEGEARSALDAVRAARQMTGKQAGPNTVVWGHSQGGHAALWTGIVAPRYAPDVPIAGVAAAAPATDLRQLLVRNQHAPVGRIMTSFAIRAYGETYADVALERYVGGPMAGILARDMARRCLAGLPALFSVAEALLLGGTIFSAPPDQGPFGERLAENTPDRLLPQALLVAQGLTDDLVLPDVQQRWAEQRCAAGQSLEFRRYAGLDHLALVGSQSPFTVDLLRWTEDRFAGLPVPGGCSLPALP